MPEPASLNSSQVGSVVFSALKYHHFYHDYKHRLYKCATWWFSVEQENLGKLLLAGTLAFLTLKAFYMHKNRYNTLTGREEMKMPWQASSIFQWKKKYSSQQEHVSIFHFHLWILLNPRQAWHLTKKIFGSHSNACLRSTQSPVQSPEVCVSDGQGCQTGRAG